MKIELMTDEDDQIVEVFRKSDFEKIGKRGILKSEKGINKAFQEGDEEDRHYWLGYQDAINLFKVEK